MKPAPQGRSRGALRGGDGEFLSGEETRRQECRRSVGRVSAAETGREMHRERVAGIKVVVVSGNLALAVFA